MTVPTLKAALERSESTLRRDIKLMDEGLGAPIRWDGPSNTYWYTRRCNTLPFVRIEAEEAFALAHVAAIFAAVPEVPLAQLFARFLEKITPMLGGAVSFPLDEVGIRVLARATGFADLRSNRGTSSSRRSIDTRARRSLAKKPRLGGRPLPHSLVTNLRTPPALDNAGCVTLPTPRSYPA